jgi:porin
VNGKNRSRIAKVCLAASSAVLILASESFGQEPVEEPSEEAEAPEAPSDLGNGLLSGPRWSPEPLTGDWFGARSWLADRGLTIGINLVDTYQGVVEGGRDRDWDNGGSLYIESQFNTERAGLWPGGFLDFRAEKQYGSFPNKEASTFPAVNMIGLFPEPDEDSVVISKLMATQFVAPWLGFFIGRFDTLDGDTNNLLSGRGRTGFLAPQLAFSPNSVPTTPYVLNGLGSIVFTPNPFMKRPATLNLVFADPLVEPTDSGLGSDFFDEQYYALDWRFPTFFFGLPGSQNITYNYNTKEFLELDNLTQQFITQTRSSNSGAGVIAYNFHQYVYVEPGQDKKTTGFDADAERLQGVGVFGRVGYANADVNPLNWTFAVGLAGRGIIPQRDDDTFGIGYYYGLVSDNVSDLSGALSDDYWGLEAYYNVSVTPWLHVTPDFQVTDPFLTGIDITYVLGGRAKVDF